MMKRLFVACLMAGLLLSASTPAFADLYENTQNLDRTVGWSTSSYTFEWSQTYDSSPDPIISATLTIVANGVDKGEEDNINYWDESKSEWRNLGTLTQLSGSAGNAVDPHTTTVFTLPSPNTWLVSKGGFDVQLVVENLWKVTIETATLSVERDPPAVVPLPPAVLLSFLGLGTAGMKLRRGRPRS